MEQAKETFYTLVDRHAQELEKDGQHATATALNMLLDFSGDFEKPLQDLRLEDLATLDTSNPATFWHEMSYGATFLMFDEDIAEAFHVEGENATNSRYLLDLQATFLRKAWGIIERMQKEYKRQG